ncbi:MAG: hypothetical protein ACKOC8_11595 [Pirellulales bacterium]
MTIDWKGVYAAATTEFYAGVRSGSETVRAPRRPLVGDEREDVLRVIRTAIATRPTATK